MGVEASVVGGDGGGEDGEEGMMCVVKRVRSKGHADEGIENEDWVVRRGRWGVNAQDCCGGCGRDRGGVVAVFEAVKGR